MLKPDALFAHLLASNELISVLDAYGKLVGRRPVQWLNQIHTRPVMELAAATRPLVFQGLTIRLDALVVNSRTRRPTEQHFAGKPYDQAAWSGVFRAWPICSCP